MLSKPQFVGEKSGTTLKDSCVLIMGQSPSSNSYNTSGDGLPFYQGNADFGEESPVPRSWCTELKKIAEKGDILISVRAPIGAINIADEKCCIGRGVAAIRPNQEVMSPDFLQHQLFASRNKLEAMGTGSTFKAIGKKTLSDFPVVIYPKNTQEAIAQQLNLIKKQIKTVNSQLDQLDSLVKSRFVEMFGDICEGTSRYDMVPINDLCIRIVGGGTPSTNHPEYYENGTIPWLKSGDVKTHIVESGVLNITEVGLAKSSARMVPEGSIIVVTRSGILKHSLPIAKTARSIAINQDLKALIPGNHILPDYLQWSLIVASPLLLSKVRATTADNIETSFLKSFRVPFPPMFLQRKFVKLVNQVDKSRFISMSRYRDILIKNGYRHPHLQDFNR